MARLGSIRRVPAVIVACAVAALAGMGSARASVLTPTPTLPLLGFPYDTAGGNCFPAVNLCVASSEFTLTSLKPPGFVQSGSNEFITTNATDTIQLVRDTLPHIPEGSVTLTGTIEQEVLGRLNNFDQGSWTVDLVSMSLTGTLLGHTLTLTLNPAHTSSGTTTIAEDGALFRIDSFFDVFAEITLDLPSGTLTATPSGSATATGVPEPGTLALLAGSLPVMLAAMRRRRRRQPWDAAQPA
jgi:hypothetical protein